VWPLPFVASLFIGTGLAEGLRGRPVGLYTAAALLCLSSRNGGQNAIVYSGFWIAWVTAAASLRSSEPPLTGLAAILASAYIGAVSVELYRGISHPFLVIAGFAALPVGVMVPDGRPGFGAWRRALCVLSAGVAAAVMEYYAVMTPDSYTVTSSWMRWSHVHAGTGVHVVLAVTAGLYAACGVFLGWLIHNLFGRTPLRSRLVRALPLLIALAAAPKIFVVPGVEALALGLARGSGWAKSEIAEWLMLALLSFAVVGLLTVEWRRAAARTLTT
jgi:hypothetical protein